MYLYYTYNIYIYIYMIISTGARYQGQWLGNTRHGFGRQALYNMMSYYDIFYVVYHILYNVRNYMIM